MPAPHLSASIRPRALVRFMHCQWLELQRSPAFSLPTLLFPVMFYAFFGLVLIPHHSQYLLVTFATFGVLGAALFSFGVGVATERARGWFTLLRATPAPLAGVVAGKWFGAALFAALATILMCLLAAAFGEVRMAAGQWLSLVATLTLGTLPFCLLGLAVGLLAAPNAAPAIINIVYLPLGFLSGLWVPVSQFPGWLQALAEWLPPYHLAALALHVTGTQATDPLWHLLILVAFCLPLAWLVRVGWRRMMRSP